MCLIDFLIKLFQLVMSVFILTTVYIAQHVQFIINVKAAVTAVIWASFADVPQRPESLRS